MVARYGFIDEASGYAPLYWGETTNLPDYAIAGRQFVALDDFAILEAENRELRARLETVEAAGRELANCAYNISQRGEMSERERVFLRETQCNWDSAIRNLEPRHD